VCVTVAPLWWPGTPWGAGSASVAGCGRSGTAEGRCVRKSCRAYLCIEQVLAGSAVSVGVQAVSWHSQSELEQRWQCVMVCMCPLRWLHSEEMTALRMSSDISSRH